jgi:hypothetical protein
MALGSPATFSARIRFEFPASQFFISLERVQYIADGSIQDEKTKGKEPLEVVTAVWSGMYMIDMPSINIYCQVSVLCTLGSIYHCVVLLFDLLYLLLPHLHGRIVN